MLFLGKRKQCLSQVTLLVVPGHRGLSSPGRDSWESTGGDVIAFIFRPGGLNQTIRLVASADNMTINQCAPGFGLKWPGDGVAASFFKGDFGLLTRTMGVTIYC